MSGRYATYEQADGTVVDVTKVMWDDTPSKWKDAVRIGRVTKYIDTIIEREIDMDEDSEDDDLDFDLDLDFDQDSENSEKTFSNGD